MRGRYVCRRAFDGYRPKDTAWDSVLQLDALLEAWDIHSFNSTQARQALLVLHRLEEGHRRGVEDLDKECDRHRTLLITESVRRSMGSSDGRPQDEQSPCNPLLWQMKNAGLVDQKVAKARVTVVRHSVKQDTSARKSVRQGLGGVEDDPWGVSQGLSGIQGIHCRRGSASRQEENDSVTVVVMPKMDLGYRARDKLWTGYLAHRQLAAGSCVMHSLGFSDRDPMETLFYYEHVKARPAVTLLSRRRLREEDVLFHYWARCALICLAQISKQSTFCLARQISLSNLMIAEQGTVVRLGGLLWGPEIRGAGKAIEECLQAREAELCLSYAGVLEDLLGIGQARGGSHDTSPPRPSVMLANILACLRLPPMEREGIHLKGLLGHRYFAPLHSEDMDNPLCLGTAWKTFINQESDV
ncbi:unnamed protein product [Ascophyllum nodosum]